jgi:hypothetical protein
MMFSREQNSQWAEIWNDKCIFQWRTLAVATCGARADRLLTGPTRKYQVTSTPNWVPKTRISISTNYTHTPHNTSEHFGRFRKDEIGILDMVTFFPWKRGSVFRVPVSRTTASWNPAGVEKQLCKVQMCIINTNNNNKTVLNRTRLIENYYYNLCALEIGVFPT